MVPDRYVTRMPDDQMYQNRLIKWTGTFGILGGLLLLLEIPLWIIPGDAGQISDAATHSAYLGFRCQHPNDS